MGWLALAVAFAGLCIGSGLNNIAKAIAGASPKKTKKAMKLLNKVRAAGYKVVDRKTSQGVRIITIEGGGSWTRFVIKPWVNPRDIVQELIRRCNGYINNPINQ